MIDFLFVTWDGGGNLPPALGIASELRERGQGVAFIGHAAQRAAIERAAFGFAAYKHALPWSSADPACLTDVFEMFTDDGPGIDLLEAVARQQPRVVVADCLALGALRAAWEDGLPRAVLGHTYYDYLAGWSKGPIGQLGRAKGLDAGRLWESADLFLVATDPLLDPVGTDQPPVNVRQTGVVQPAPVARAFAADGDDRQRADGRPRVLVSLSTTFYPGQRQTLQTIIDAIADLPADVVVTTGPAIEPAEVRAAPNVLLHQYLPHAEILPSVSLVIGHGGHATTMRALAHDVPLLIMPMHPMLDQEMIGKSVAAHGAGQVLPADAQPDQIAEVADELLAPGAHRSAAAYLGGGLRSRPGAPVAADHLMTLLQP